MYNEKIVGKRIAAARTKMNLSRGETAQLMAISVQAVGKWERGESLPDLITLKKLSDLFKEDINFFFDGNVEGAERYTADAEKENNETVIAPKRKWDMSASNWKNADFSGLNNIADKFKNSNIQKCNFSCSDLSGITFKSNNIHKCDFTDAKLSSGKFSMCNMPVNNFLNCSFKDTVIKMCSMQGCDFSGADFTNAEINGCAFNKNKLGGTIFYGTSFAGTVFNGVVIDSDITECSFAGCSYRNVKFEGVTFRNTFFKNQMVKKVIFENCKADNITYSFLKNSKADLEGLSLSKDC